VTRWRRVRDDVAPPAHRVDGQAAANNSYNVVKLTYIGACLEASRGRGYWMSKPGEVGNRRGAGELAGQVLGILQAADEPLSPAAVRERLSGELAYTTVVTILSRLHAKGVLDRERVGRAFRYRPVADEPGLAARRMALVLAAEPDREAVLQRFVSALSEQDEQALRRMIGDSGGAGGR
jgi:predicted transcriptional regulator